MKLNHLFNVVIEGTGHSKFVRTGPTLSGGEGRGVIVNTTYLMNIADKLLLALKFELTQNSKYSDDESQHYKINKKSEVGISSYCHLLLLDKRVAMQ